MNVVYAFVGKLPSYSVVTVKQLRYFYDGPVYFILNDLHSEYVEQLKGFNVEIIDYDSVKHAKFNSIVEEYSEKFCIVHNLKGREKLFIHSFERFFLLYNLMLLKNLSNVFFVELDNLLFNTPEVWLDSFQQKEMAYLFDNYDRCSSGVAFIKSPPILNDFMEFSLNWIASTSDFLTEMTALYRFWETNKERVQLLPTHWNDESVPDMCYSTFSNYSSIFDALSIGIYLTGIDTIHSGGVVTTGRKSEWGLIDFTKYAYRWIFDEKNRRVPVVYINNNIYRINNLHVHSKDLEPYLSR